MSRRFEPTHVFHVSRGGPDGDLVETTMTLDWGIVRAEALSKQLPAAHFYVWERVPGKDQKRVRGMAFDGRGTFADKCKACIGRGPWGCTACLGEGYVRSHAP